MAIGMTRGSHAQPIPNIRRLRWAGTLPVQSRIRRNRNLEAEDPFENIASPFDAENPFEVISAGRRIRDRLVVGVHAPGLTDLTPDEAWLVGQIARASEDWGVRVFAVGASTTEWNGVPVMKFMPRSGAPWSKAGRIQWDADTHSERELMLLDNRLLSLRPRLPAGAMDAARDVLAAYEAGAHVVISNNPALLRARAIAGLEEANVITPLEAAVLLGVWARATGRNGVFAHWASGDFMSYWALARAVTPAGWSSFSGFVAGSRTFPDGARLQALAQSILARLDYLVEALDDMYLLWQRDVTTPVLEDVGNLLDGILLRGWAVQDNAAMLVTTWFEAVIPDPAWISLHERRWRQAIRQRGDEAVAVVAGLQRVAQRLCASQTLRHHAVHRENLDVVTVQDEHGQKDVRIFLPSPVSRELRQGLASTQESPHDWGLESEIAPRIVHTATDHGGGVIDEFDEETQGGAFLDPMIFASRFVAAVAELANELFRLVQPASDPRLSQAARTRVLRLDRSGWADPAVGWQLVLSSPLCGLVPRAAP